MRHKKNFFFLLSLLSLAFSPLQSEEKRGDPFTCFVEEGKWEELLIQSKIALKRENSTEALYYKGVAFFHLGEYELANKSFNHYIERESRGQHVEEILKLKHQIAEMFAQGDQLHLFGVRWMPRLASGHNEAYQIYDELITSSPRSDLAARAFIGKGKLLFRNGKYQEAIEEMKHFIKLFQVHFIIPEAHLLIGKSYLEQMRASFVDLDLIDGAKINQMQFRENFPGDRRVEKLDQYLDEMEDVYAADWFKTGRFFEKRKKYRSAYFYYQKVVEKCATSSYRALSSARMKELLKKHPQEIFDQVEKSSLAQN